METTEIGRVVIRPDRITVDVRLYESKALAPFIQVTRCEVTRQNEDPPMVLTATEAEDLAGLLLKAAVKARHVEYLNRRRAKKTWARRAAEVTAASFSASELEAAPEVGPTAECPGCGSQHPVIESKPSGTLKAVKCGEHMYLVAVNNRSV